MKSKNAQRETILGVGYGETSTNVSHQAKVEFCHEQTTFFLLPISRSSHQLLTYEIL